MKLANPPITGCRRALSGAAVRRAAFALALVVLAFQFGLVQHSIEHGAPFPDAGCEVCVAGGHHASLPVVGALVVVPATAADLTLHTHAGTPARKLHTLHLARGPPALS